MSLNSSCASKQRFLHRRRLALRQQLALRLCGCDPLARNVKVRAVDLNSDEPLSHVRRRYAGRPAPHERVKHHVAAQNEQVLQQPLRLAGDVVLFLAVRGSRSGSWFSPGVKKPTGVGGYSL